MKFRALLMWIHLVLGLTGAVVIAIASLTGVYITFQHPLERWLNAVPHVAAGGSRLDVATIVSHVEAKVAPRRVASVELRDGEAAVVMLRDNTTVFVHPADGSIMASRPRRFASLYNLTRVMRGLHTNLLVGRRGVLVVTFATAEALLLALTGLWLWWRKKHWRIWPWRGSVFRVSWDVHSATGIWFAVPALVMTTTGLLIAMPAPIYRLAGADPAPWLNPPLSTATGAEPVPVARALAVADSVRAGAAITRLTIPSAGAFAASGAGVTVFIDQYSGAVLAVRPDRVPTSGDTAYQAFEAAHTGALFGAPGQLVMTLGSLMLAIMTVTGAVLGVKRVMILAGRWRE